MIMARSAAVLAPPGAISSNEDAAPLTNGDILRPTSPQKRPAVAISLLCAAWFGSGISTAADLRLMTEEGPPFNMTEPGTKRVVGMSTELLEAALKSAAVPYTIISASWKRAYETALLEPDACVYSTTLTDERRPLFSWIGPLFVNEWVLIAKAGAPAPKSIDELRGKIFGGYYGDATTDFLVARGMTVDQSATNDASNIRKLDAGRIDYWVVGRPRYLHLKKTIGVEGLAEMLTINSTELYLACNRAVPDDVVERLRQAIRTLRADGTVEAIRRRYE